MGPHTSRPLLIDKTTNVRAIAYKTGQTESNVMNVTFTIGVKVATPTFSILAGTYALSQSVVLATTTAGATIRYTTNGVNPTQTYGTMYTGPVTVSKTQTLKAIAYQPLPTSASIPPSRATAPATCTWPTTTTPATI